MLLELKEITVHYGTAQALTEVSIGVEEGDFVTIIGSNGAGKTTTLKTTMGLVHPTNGEVWFEGHRIDGLRPHEISKKGIGFCMEGRRLFPLMTVRENLEMGAFLRRDSNIDGDIEAIFGYFPRLQERQKQKAGTMSGGEQQMLAIARILMSKPKLLMLDEPSLGLAPIVVREIGEIIGRLNEEGLSVLLVEQNALLALKLARKGYVLEVGKVMMKGGTKDICGNDHVKKAYLGL